MVHEAARWGFLVILLYAGWKDLKIRRISQIFLVLSGGFGIILCMFSERSVKEIVAACAIGVVLLVFSRLTGGKIGEGDGWFFIMAGLFLGWEQIVFLFLGGLLCAFFVSVVILLQERIRKINGKKCIDRKKSLPFLTFLVPAGLCISMGWI